MVIVRSGRRLQVPLLVLREYRSICGTVPIGVEGVPTLSRFSESSSCWHLRVTLTPERPSSWKKIKKDFVGQLTADMLTTSDEAKETFFDGTNAYYLTDAGRERLQRVISEEIRALDSGEARAPRAKPDTMGL